MGREPLARGGHSRAAGLLLAKLVFCAALLSGAPIGPAWADMQSFYDPAGRLIAVIDPVNGSAQYAYDATGNILSIVRQPASALVVIPTNFSGTVGSTVSIHGTGFDTTADTAVNFNGTPATPTAVTPTQITVVVPSGATTGPLTVTSPAGSVTTTAAFVIGTPPGPTIASVSPTTAAPGATVTIAGSNFDAVSTNTKTFINSQYPVVTALSATAITATVPTASSGRITVETAAGTATSASDFIIPPPGYTTGAVTSVVRGTLGQTVSISVSGPSGVSLVLFDGTAGQLANVFLQLSGCNAIRVLAPDGSILISTSTCGSTLFTNTFPMHQTGTYSVTIAPLGTTSGTATATLLAVPADATAAASLDGTASTVTIATPGQHGDFTFSGTAGQRVSFYLLLPSGCAAVSVLNPDNTPLVNGFFTCNTSNGFFASPTTLAQSGTYTLSVVPSLGNTLTSGTGMVTARLFNVPADPTATVALDGSASMLTLTTPGQHASFTFNGTSGQRVSFYFLLSLNACNTIAVLNPDGTPLVTGTFTCNTGGFVASPSALAQTGTYRITIVPSLGGSTSNGTGTATAQVFNVPADPTATAAMDGSTTSINLTAPGQHGSFTFAGTAGQRLTFFLTLASSPCNTISVSNPDNTLLINGAFTCSTSNFFQNSSTSAPFVLAQTGTYRITITPSLGSAATSGTGTETVQLFNVPADPNNTVSIGGATVTDTLTTPGQHANFTFSSASGQRVNLVVDLTGLGGCNTISVINPDGSFLINQAFTCSSSYAPSTLNLAQAGTYQITVITSRTGTVTATLSLSS